MENKKVLIRLDNLKQWFPVKKTKFGEKQRYVRANDGVSLNIYEGETLGLVGESGCGKSTLARSLLQLYVPSGGRAMYYGRTIEDIAPSYVTELLSNPSKALKDLEDFKVKAEELRVASENATGDDIVFALDEYKKARNSADMKFEEISGLLGGFMVVDGIDDACKAMLPIFETSAKMAEIKITMNELKIEINKKLSIAKEKSGNANSDVASKQQSELDALNKQYNELAKTRETQKKAVDDLRKKYANDAKFQEYEKFIDNGIDLAKLKYKEMRNLRSELQIIFQDPYSSLNPRMTVGQIISEGLTAHNYFSQNDPGMQDYVMKTMEECGLSSYMIHRYPHQFSGGQRQRIGIARSLAMRPKFVVCDEAVSALDVSIQSQVINLLKDLRDAENLTYLFISHDLSVIKYISDRIGVMYLGKLVELAETAPMFDLPLHPYTQALLDAIPTTDIDATKDAPLLEGDIPSPVKPPPGCKFHTRCRFCQDLCRIDEPEIREVLPGRFISCHYPLTNERRAELGLKLGVVAD